MSHSFHQQHIDQPIAGHRHGFGNTIELQIELRNRVGFFALHKAVSRFRNAVCRPLHRQRNPVSHSAYVGGCLHIAVCYERLVKAALCFQSGRFYVGCRECRGQFSTLRYRYDCVSAQQIFRSTVQANLMTFKTPSQAAGGYRLNLQLDQKGRTSLSLAHVSHGLLSHSRSG